ncbi:MAG: hypothetical protein ABGW78_14480 [Pirellulales bacterium]
MGSGPCTVGKIHFSYQFNEDGHVTEAEWKKWSKADTKQNGKSNKSGKQKKDLFNSDPDSHGVVTRK